MTYVVGIDTKSRGFHWSAGSGHDWSFGGWVSSQEDQDLARAEVFRRATEFFKELPVGGHVLIEAPLALKNGATTRLLCMAAAAVYCGFVAADADGFVYWVDPSRWKLAVLGRGAPPKGEKHKPWIRRRVQEIWPSMAVWDKFDNEPDLYDAWCLQQYGFQVVDS